MPDHSIIEGFKDAVTRDDFTTVKALLNQHAGALRAAADCGNAGSVLAAARSPAMVDLLLEHGASIDRLSAWWAPGFWLGQVPTAVSEHLLARGARLTPHAAAALGLADRLLRLLDEDPSRVHQKGGDGCRPLHFSRTVEIAEMLLGRGAEIDARDDDHASTAAQWRIGDAPDVTRHLLLRGATPDIFMAAGLNDLALAETLVGMNPACTTWRIGNNSGPFPGIGFEGRGGTIYQWTLGFNQSPQEIALSRGHRDLFAFLMERTPARSQFLIACMIADRPLAQRLLAEQPRLIGELEEEDLALLAKSCWETNLNPDAVRLMLDVGFPVAAREFNHGYQPLHNSAWAGHVALVELLIERGHPVDDKDPAYQGTPVNWAIHSCLEAKRHPEGDFPAVIERLLQAGAKVPEGKYPTGCEPIDAVLRRHLNR